MRYKFTVNKTKLYKLARDNWPHPMPEFQRCEFKQYRGRSFWLFCDSLQVYLTVCAGCAMLVIDDPTVDRFVRPFSVEDMLARFMVKLVGC